MRRLICLLLPLLFAVGCATSADRAAYHQAQVEAIKVQMEAIKNLKPMVSITAQPGQNIVMSGVQKFEVYSPMTGAEWKTVEQFKDEYVPVYLSAMNLMGIPISIATQGYFFNEALKTTIAGKGGNTYYGNNNTGQQGSQFGTGSTIGSPFGAASNANGNASSSPTNAPVTTTTEGMPAP